MANELSIMREVRCIWDGNHQRATWQHLVMERLEEVRGHSARVCVSECGFLATVGLVLLRFFYTDGQMSQFESTYDRFHQQLWFFFLGFLLPVERSFVQNCRRLSRDGLSSRIFMQPITNLNQTDQENKHVDHQN